MKRTKKILIFILVFALMSVSAIALTACDNSTLIPDHEHEWNDWVTGSAATCDTAQVKTRTCKGNSSHTETETVTPALGHNYQWVQTTPAGVRTAAVETYKCSRCAATNGTRAGAHATGTEGLVFAFSTSFEPEEFHSYHVVGYTGESTDVVIPVDYCDEEHEEYGYLPVTTISLAFQDNTDIESVFIPDSITEIVSASFKGCTSLESITIPFVGTDAEHGVFADIFDGVSFVPSSLQTVILTGGDELPSNAFANCENIESIVLPDGIQTINSGAFQGCISLESIVLPDSVEYIFSDAFRDCTNLENIVLPGGLVTLGSGVFRGCEKLESIVIPNSVGFIGTDAFRGCIGLESITIPFVGLFPGVLDVESSLFGWIFGYEQDTTEIAGYHYFDGTSYYLYYIPESLKTVIITGDYDIPDYAFNNCTDIMWIIIRGAVENIGDYAFNGCTSLAYIVIPESMDYIGGYAFDNCSSLGTVYFGGLYSGDLYNGGVAFADWLEVMFGMGTGNDILGSGIACYYTESTTKPGTSTYWCWTLNGEPMVIIWA